MSSTTGSELHAGDHSSGAAVDAERTEIRGEQAYTVPSPIAQSGSNPISVHELVGQNLDHYRIESLVGVGGMGAVFRGRDLRLDRVVAIKVVPMTHRRAEAMRRFRMEAQSAAKLDHPNIARVHYVGETDRWSYIVFEFIEGTNLRQLVLEQGPLSIDDATHFVCQVAEALQHAHDRGVVHRDIKPSNILIGRDGRAKIVDMGLARTTQLDRSTGDLTASGVTLGTFDYISPEQAHDPRDADVRSDIYSLGCTLYFLLTGQPPFPDGTPLQKLLMHGTKLPEDPRCYRNDVSDPLIAILRKMMAKRPRDRYQEPADLVNDLRTLAGIDSLAWRDELPEDLQHSVHSQRGWWEFSLPGLICIGAIAMVTLWLYNTNQRSAVFVIPRVEVADANGGEEPVPNEMPRPKESPDTPLPAQGNADSNATTSPANNAAKTANLTKISDSKPRSSDVVAPSILGSASVVVVRDGASDLTFLKEPFESAISLEDAIAKASASEWVNRIVLAVPSITLTKPVSLAGSVNRKILRVESQPKARTQVWVGDSVLRSTSDLPSGWIRLEGAQYEFCNLDFHWSAADKEATPPALFSIASGAHCVLEDASVTIRSTSVGKLPAVLRLQNASVPDDGSKKNTTTLSARRTCMRGQCDLVQVDSNDRMELNLENCWTAISGSMIDIQGARSLNRSPRIRAELLHVTSITLQPWLRIRMNTTHPYPVAFVRVANESIFAGSNTLVEWDASNVSDWSFAPQAKRIEDLGRWIDLRGLDNVYDVPSILRLVQVIMSMSSEEVAIDSDTNLLRHERGMELLSPWRSSPRLDAATMHTLLPDNAAWPHSGLQPGCRPDELPTLSDDTNTLAGAKTP